MSSRVDSLTSPQRAALGQLQAITNGADASNEIAILSSVNWDVQRAVDLIFDSQTTVKRPMFEELQVDDSAQGIPPTPRSRGNLLPIIRLGLNVVSIITFPLSFSLNVLSHLMHFLFRILRIPFPRLNFTGISFNFPTRLRPPAPDDPASAADRFVRALEEETGAQVLSRARASTCASHEPGPSSAAAAQDPLFDDSRKILPDFWLGSYESALGVARRDARILCVILLSSEHDDVLAFRRNVLTDPLFVRSIAENEILVWAGDIREPDAYQASFKLTATTYPFVAFVALQSRARGSNNADSPSLAILSRHSGAAATSAAQLAHHIIATILPRHQPFLTRLQAQARTRERDRALRAEQDAAFAVAQRADAQRILQRRAEEIERTRLEEVRLAAERAERRAKVWRVLWRRNALERLDKSEGRPSVRIGVRVPDGRRAVRWFRESDQIADVYAWVDSVLAEGQGADNTVEEQAVVDDDQNAPEYESDAIPDWHFCLAVAFPRSILRCEPGRRVEDVAALRGGANLVIEGIAPVGGTGSESEEEEA